MKKLWILAASCALFVLCGVNRKRIGGGWQTMMQKLAAMRILSLLILCGLCASCTTSGVQVRQSGTRPGWVVSEKDWWEEQGEWRFRGRVENADDMALGLREAEAEAIKMVAERLRLVVRTEFSAYAKRVGLSSAATARVVSDGVAWVSDNVAISGVYPVKSWYRATTRPGHGTPTYECHRVVAISKQDFSMAQQMILTQMAETARGTGNRDLEAAAREILEKVEGW